MNTSAVAISSASSPLVTKLDAFETKIDNYDFSTKKFAVVGILKSVIGIPSLVWVKV
jgi:hypothetical protein